MIVNDLPDEPEGSRGGPDGCGPLGATSFICELLGRRDRRERAAVVSSGRACREITNHVMEMIAYAGRAYGNWLDAAGAAKLEIEDQPATRPFAWSEELRFRRLGIELD